MYVLLKYSNICEKFIKTRKKLQISSINYYQSGIPANMCLTLSKKNISILDPGIADNYRVLIFTTDDF